MRLKGSTHKFSVIFSAVLIGIFTATSAFATIYYVSTSGNDQTGDGSTTRPWATLSFACSRVNVFSDVIQVNAGSYTDNAQCVLARGVKIMGASSGTTSIGTTANPYILASSSVPTVDGSNEISGIAFSGANEAIRSIGRNNQKIHDNTFTNFATWLRIEGKSPAFVSTCVGGEGSATHCDNNKLLTVYPTSTDWATGAEIYNNTVTNSNLYPRTLKNSVIHNNSIDNSAADRSAIGHTGLFYENVDIYNNTILMHSATYTNIAVEMWHVAADTKFRDNMTNGWISFNFNPYGPTTPYSLEIYNNDLSSDVVSSVIHTAIEVAGWITNVRVYGNYVANIGANKPWDIGVYINGAGTMRNIMIDHNVFYKINSSDVGINSTQPWSQPMDLDNVYIYNNVFDHGAGNTSVAILLENDGTHGDIDGVFVRNNLFMNMKYGVGFWPQPPVTTSGNFFDHNAVYNMTGYVDSAHDNGSFTVGTNYTLTPEIIGSGSRWKNYYRPNGPNSNLVDRGTAVGLPYLGVAPDIGTYEYAVLAPPSGLTVTAP